MFLHFGRSIPSIMGEDDAICAHVLRYALAIVGIFRCGPSTYSYKPIRKGIFVRIDRYLTIPNNIFLFFFYGIPFTIVSYNFDLRGITFQLTVRRSVIVQRSRGLRSGRCNGWSWLRSWPWRCRTRCRADGTCAALLPLWNTSTSWTNLPEWSLVNVQL